MDAFFCPLCGSREELVATRFDGFSGYCSQCETYFYVLEKNDYVPFQPDIEAFEREQADRTITFGPAK